MKSLMLSPIWLTSCDTWSRQLMHMRQRQHILTFLVGTITSKNSRRLQPFVEEYRGTSKSLLSCHINYALPEMRPTHDAPLTTCTLKTVKRFSYDENCLFHRRHKLIDSKSLVTGSSRCTTLNIVSVSFWFSFPFNSKPFAIDVNIKRFLFSFWSEKSMLEYVKKKTVKLFPHNLLFHVIDSIMSDVNEREKSGKISLKLMLVRRRDVWKCSPFAIYALIYRISFRSQKWFFDFFSSATLTGKDTYKAKQREKSRW